jgi:hypothetical protein
MAFSAFLWRGHTPLLRNITEKRMDRWMLDGECEFAKMESLRQFKKSSPLLFVPH